MLFNGDDVSSEVTNINDTFSNVDIEIIRIDNDELLSVFPAGPSVTVRVAAGIPNFVLTLPQELRGMTRGLVGNYNGDDSDDFIYPNGTMLANDTTDRMIHQFGQTCELKAVTYCTM